MLRRLVGADNDIKGWNFWVHQKLKKNTFLHLHCHPTVPPVSTNLLCQIGLSHKRPHSPAYSYCRWQWPLYRLLLLLLLLLLTIHEDTSVGSLATPTVLVEDGFGWTMLCAMATNVTLILVITVHGAFTTVVTVKMSPSRVWQVWSLLQQLKYERSQSEQLSQAAQAQHCY